MTAITSPGTYRHAGRTPPEIAAFLAADGWTSRDGLEWVKGWLIAWPALAADGAGTPRQGHVLCVEPRTAWLPRLPGEGHCRTASRPAGACWTDAAPDGR